jgi:hypothetical protein
MATLRVLSYVLGEVFALIELRVLALLCLLFDLWTFICPRLGLLLGAFLAFLILTFVWLGFSLFVLPCSLFSSPSFFDSV